MCFASPLDGGEFVAPPPCFEKALDVFLLLHADHEQNASTSTVRMAASSEANPFACVAAGIASLWGPMHGGANEACIRMLREILCGNQPVSRVHFFTKSFLGDDVAALAPSSGEEPASPRHRACVASMAWRSTRLFRTDAP